ncbi:MAG: T9SS type A sorting domain-containing protein, partial [Bacteroidales bacterium]|nr:T9SS type A sorting domain-containing protein [Bacteroidales bacterium]
ITIGIINVSVAGCDIRLFDKDIYQEYDSTYTDNWFTSLVAAYDWNPYQYLVNLAKLAQNDGIVKGILLHQGETNTGNSLWLSYVKKIYNDMLTDLSLNADSVPLLAGELLSAPGNCCSSMNTIINRLPDTIPTAYVISSSGCPGQDEAHFDTEGNRKIGRRYAVQMLSLMGYESVYAEAECGTVGNNLHILADNNASNTAYVTAVKSITASPADDADIIKMSVSVVTDTNFCLYGRFNNSKASHNAFWLKIDDAEFEFYDNMFTNGWEWLELKSFELTAGEHTFSFAFAEDSVMLDKIAVKNSQITPVDVGEEAVNLCEADITTSNIDLNLEGYALEQNYPNPVTKRNVSIPFKIPDTGFVSLKIFNALGIDIDEPAGKVFYAGDHVIEYNLEKLSPGIYFYTMKTGNYSATRKMIITD